MDNRVIDLLNKLNEEVTQLRHEVSLLKLEIRLLKDQTKPLEKYQEKRKILEPPKKIHELLPTVQPGSPDEWFKQNILPKIIEEERLIEEKLKGKAKLEIEETVKNDE